MAVLPLHVYRRGAGDDRAEVPAAADEVAAAGLRTAGVAARLAADPCPEMGPLTFWETLVAHAINRGNGYAEIEEDGAGNPIALWPLVPSQTYPARDPKTRELVYETWGAGVRTTIPARNVFHLAGLGFDGLGGYSVVTMARRSLGLTATAEQAGEGFLGNGMRPGGWIEFPGSLQDLQKSNVEEAVRAKHAGATKFGKTLVLYGNAKYHQLDISPEDAQFLETRQFQVEEISRWYNVPPHKIKHLQRATFSNIEQQSQEFVTDTLLYWLTKIVQEFGRKLLARYGGSLFAEHTLDALLRGDTLARYTAYGVGRQWGFLSPNDCRRKENMGPIPDGDVYHVPVNMTPLGSGPAKEPALVPGKPPAPDEAARSTAAAVATSVARELCERDAAELVAMAEQDAGLLASWAGRASADDWAWAVEVVEVRCHVLAHLTGRAVSSAVVAAEYGARRIAQVKAIAGAGDVTTTAAVVAAGWRPDVAGVRDLILGAAR